MNEESNSVDRFYLTALSTLSLNSSWTPLKSSLDTSSKSMPKKNGWYFIIWIDFRLWPSLLEGEIYIILLIRSWAYVLGWLAGSPQFASGHVIFLCVIFFLISSLESPTKGSDPVHILNKTFPSAQTSTGNPYASSLITSGAYVPPSWQLNG